MKVAAIIGMIILALLILWIAGEEIYNHGYIDGRSDGYKEGAKDEHRRNG